MTTELQASGDSQGRISYENRGECFFLPYTKDDVEGNVTLRAGDKVSFQIATNQRYDILMFVNKMRKTCISSNFSVSFIHYNANAYILEETWVHVT